ncbi:MAG: hypothetical protein ACRELZ_14725 [Candidatus Rokuibacteriota bacterium]
MLTAVTFVVAAICALTPTGSAQVVGPSLAGVELVQVLGDGVIGGPESAPPLRDPGRIARWETGQWQYRITAGARRGQTEVESLAPIGATARGETWKRTIGQDSTLFLREVTGGGLVLPSQITHPHRAVVHFEPPLTYLIAGLGPGESRVFDGRMDVYSVDNPAIRWYTGRIRATTVYAGVYRVTTPAGAFRAALIKTEYQIDILAVVSVRDTLYSFYAEGVGKVAEAEHRRIAALGLFSTDTKIGKVLVSYTPVRLPGVNESP